LAPSQTRFDRNWNGALFCLAAAAILLLYANKTRVPFFRANMLREAQTASVVQDYIENGIHLLESKLAFMLPQPSYLLLEFPIYQAIVAAAANVVDYETFGKLLSVFSFIGSLTFVYLIAHRILRSARAGVLAVVIMAAMPMNILMQAAFMIDAAVQCLSLGALYFGLRWNDLRQGRDLLIATLLGTLAAVVKPFGLFPLVFPLVFVVAHSVFVLRERPAARSTAALVTMGLTWAIVVAAWYLWSDYLNKQGALFQDGNGSVLTDSFIGPVIRRFQSEDWAMVRYIFTVHISLKPLWLWYGLAAAGFLAVIRHPRSRAAAFFAGALLGYLALLIIFFRAVSTHSYYSLPLVPILALLIATALDRLIALLLDRRKIGSVVGALFAFALSAATVVAAWKLLDVNWATFGSDWTYRNFDFVSFLVAAAFAISIGLAIAYYARRRSLTFGDLVSGAIACGMIGLYLPTQILPSHERFWQIPFPIHWMMTSKLADQIKFVRDSMPADRRVAVASWRANLYTEFMYMIGARGQPIAFPSAENNPETRCVVGHWA
jgi:4-amino-4-deoxy-L-arabinose transferase-like glycosyltransferase